MIEYKIDVIEALTKKGINYYTCKKSKNPFAQGTYRRLKNKEPVSFETLNILCEILECKIEDIIEYVPDSEKDA